MHELIIQEYEQEIIQKVSLNQTTIIKGPTGCGKSTLVPLILSKEYKKIALIEPRRIAVLSLYNRLNSLAKGSTGYKIRFDKKINKDNKIIIFTDGMFLREENNFDLIILDEVHERSIRIDLLISLFKINKCRLILMSANVDTEKISKFFDTNSLVEIKSKTFPLNFYYEENPICDYIKTAFSKIREIILMKIKGDILCFLPGEEDINELYLLCKGIPLVKVYKIFSTISDFDQQKIFENCENRKIILSTNICESSLTIPGISFVIDTGLQKTKILNVTDSLVGINYFGIEKISKQSAEQRAGRSNREGAGYCYRLFTKESFNNLQDNVPEILKTDLKELFLMLIHKEIDFLSLKMLDYPGRRNVEEALHFLWENKLIELRNKTNESISEHNFNKNEAIHFKITQKGREILMLPLSINIALFLHECKRKGLFNSGAMICSLLALENYNFISKNSKQNDLTFLLNAMNNYILSEDKREYCLKNNLPYKGMERGYKIYQQLNASEDNSNEDINRIFSDVFKYNASTKERNGVFKHRKNGNMVYWRGNDSIITYVDVFYCGKPYARIVGKYYE
ncbi:hypothetical protein H312_01623 [Anncaliia algerae PRA339]|uniref:ATP-dependent helicase HrpA n=1 Tax=Anncaliia algerae PRA339 TaxID=1288291 RepID=A0A059F107_9MICR|nr:hypothetical protein H312_01623 [Anncaliia algerae PRA339]